MTSAGQARPGILTKNGIDEVMSGDLEGLCRKVLVDQKGVFFGRAASRYPGEHGDEHLAGDDIFHFPLDEGAMWFTILTF